MSRRLRSGLWQVGDMTEPDGPSATSPYETHNEFLKGKVKEVAERVSCTSVTTKTLVELKEKGAVPASLQGTMSAVAELYHSVAELTSLFTHTQKLIAAARAEGYQAGLQAGMQEGDAERVKLVESFEDRLQALETRGPGGVGRGDQEDDSEEDVRRKKKKVAKVPKEVSDAARMVFHQLLWKEYPGKPNPVVSDLDYWPEPTISGKETVYVTGGDQQVEKEVYRPSWSDRSDPRTTSFLQAVEASVSQLNHGGKWSNAFVLKAISAYWATAVKNYKSQKENSSEWIAKRKTAQGKRDRERKEGLLLARQQAFPKSVLNQCKDRALFQLALADAGAFGFCYSSHLDGEAAILGIDDNLPRNEDFNAFNIYRSIAIKKGIAGEKDARDLRLVRDQTWWSKKMRLAVWTLDEEVISSQEHHITRKAPFHVPVALWHKINSVSDLPTIRPRRRNSQLPSTATGPKDGSVITPSMVSRVILTDKRYESWVSQLYPDPVIDSEDNERPSLGAILALPEHAALTRAAQRHTSDIRLRSTAELEEIAEAEKAGELERLDDLLDDAYEEEY